VNPVLEVAHLDLASPHDTICRNLSLRILPGEVWGILGPNGVGKSTLLKTLAGLSRRPPAASIRLDGQPLEHWPRRARARRMAILLQDNEPGLPLTVFETALLGRHPHLGLWGRPHYADLRRTLAALRITGLNGQRQNPSQALSAGESQRLAVALILAQDPALYLLDEPTTQLDLHYQRRLFEHFVALARWHHKAVVMALHDPTAAIRFTTRVLLLFGGGRILLGESRSCLTPDHLTTLYGTPVVAADSPRGLVFDVF
jgi:iron complex transport system ATP-binding protein